MNKYVLDFNIFVLTFDNVRQFPGNFARVYMRLHTLSCYIYNYMKSFVYSEHEIFGGEITLFSEIII